MKNSKLAQAVLAPLVQCVQQVPDWVCYTMKETRLDCRWAGGKSMALHSKVARRILNLLDGGFASIAKQSQTPTSASPTPHVVAAQYGLFTTARAISCLLAYTYLTLFGLHVPKPMCYHHVQPAIQLFLQCNMHQCPSASRSNEQHHHQRLGSLGPKRLLCQLGLLFPADAWL